MEAIGQELPEHAVERVLVEYERAAIHIGR